MSTKGAVAGVGVGLALTAAAFTVLKKTILRPRVTTPLQEEAYDYAVKLQLAAKEASNAVLWSNESAEEVHARVEWMVENWAAIYDRLMHLPDYDSVRRNFGTLTQRVVTVMVHVAMKHGRDIRATRPIPQPLAQGLSGALGK